MKVSSKQLAMIAGKYLEMSDGELCYYLDFTCFRSRANEIRALAASVLSQTEPKPKKRKVKK